MARSRKPTFVFVSMESSRARACSAFITGVLPLFTTCFDREQTGADSYLSDLLRRTGRNRARSATQVAEPSTENVRQWKITNPNRSSPEWIEGSLQIEVR